MKINEHFINAKHATQAIFLICGLALSSWAPMVPLAKERLGLNDANLGMLLLLLGGGAIFMMPISGILSHRYGTRIVILFSGIIAAITLPLLLMMPNITSMAISLFIFGAAIGTIDVAMNSHGVAVEHGYGSPIMSSLHGLFSLGGLFGSLGLGFLMKLGLQPLLAAVTIALLLIFILLLKYQRLFDLNTERAQIIKEDQKDSAPQKGKLVWLKGSVILLGISCFAIFLSEGAMLDWSAIFLTESRNVDPKLAGIGYASFSIAMATMRLLGDKIVSKLNGRIVVIGGGLIATIGIVLVVAVPYLPVSILGFILLGIGASNIVPVFFSMGSRLKDVPASIAIPAISTMGYAGQLVGPALLGFIAYRFSLHHALLFTALLIFLVAIGYGIGSRKKQSHEK